MTTHHKLNMTAIQLTYILLPTIPHLWVDFFFFFSIIYNLRPKQTGNGARAAPFTYCTFYVEHMLHLQKTVGTLLAIFSEGSSSFFRDESNLWEAERANQSTGSKCLLNQFPLSVCLLWIFSQISHYITEQILYKER